MQSRELSFNRSMTFEYGVASPISPGIVRMVAANASALTFKGTNTYLLGMTELAVIDPGPEDGTHRAAILKAAQGRPITHILVTHAHRDHVDGASALKAETGAQIYGFGRKAPAKPAVLPGITPTGAEFIDYDFTPDFRIGDGDVVEGRDWTLAAVHTPGHAPDHLCFALRGRSVLFSGDHVMAWNTTLVAPPEGAMADYIRSLQLLLKRGETVYLPGHGGRLEEPRRTVKAYLLHRRWREQSILAAIRTGSETVETIVPTVYPAIDESLSTAAGLSVLAHVEHLIARGLVTCDGTPTWDRRFAPA
jgi:glyoxylase-like metal-dependent hydrolase (beta-lactamase superfamily II)